MTGAARADVLPNVPRLAEFVPGYEASGWYGIGVPRNTPAVIVDKLNREISAGLADAKLKARLADLGYVTFAGSPAAFGTLNAQETENHRHPRQRRQFRRAADRLDQPAARRQGLRRAHHQHAPA
jgi:tripartite-type tricarboxylate transporter receptor subunit TctC